MKRKRYIRKKLYSEINITPFVDVILVLLLIFMITNQIPITGIDVDLPNSNTKPINLEKEPLSIYITKNKKIFILNNEIYINKLENKLKAIFKVKKDERIIIKADHTLNYGLIMNIMTYASNAGFNKISLVTENK